MSLAIYNTLTQKKETFVSLEPGRVRMYVCGPTVYDLLHVGNFRGPIFFNLVAGWLRAQGFEVIYVYNYTDIEDRIIQRAQRDKVASEEISSRYIVEFEKDFAALHLTAHSANPKVTEHLAAIIALIEELIEKKHAYVAGNDVNYAIDSFAEYGKLSHRNPDELQAGHRVEVDPLKRKPLDFVLWKGAKPGEPQWDSPWGPGRPGWHIECSAMAKALLGAQIDIHGGGSDLIFPHHENEIAQSEGASGHAPFARFWMHNQMLTFGSQKMSKSLGNVRTARSFMAEFSPEVLKYMMLSVHYRSLLDFSEAGIQRSFSGLARLYSAMAWAERVVALGGSGAETAADKEFAGLLKNQTAKMAEALDDDFNTPEVFARLFEVVRAYNAFARVALLNAKTAAPLVRRSEMFLQWIRESGHLMALFQEPPGTYLQSLDDLLLKQKNLDRVTIEALIEKRSAARAGRDFAEADRLRAQLTEMGIALNDSPQGTQWEVQK